MLRKRTLEEIKKDNLLKMSELADITGLRYSTIKFYAELGILPFTQKEKRLARYYPVKEATARLNEIRKLRAEKKSIPDIVNHFIKGQKRKAYRT